MPLLEQSWKFFLIGDIRERVRACRHLVHKDKLLSISTPMRVQNSNGLTDKFGRVILLSYGFCVTNDGLGWIRGWGWLRQLAVPASNDRLNELEAVKIEAIRDHLDHLVKQYGRKRNWRE